MAVIIHILAIDYFNMKLLFLFFTPIAYAAAYIMAKIKLNKIEALALNMAEIGKINTNHNS